ncbi:citrate lyase holo-[acyl-carrier protein] synthase [Edwardsiella ictaluri]|nr:citrate lyase holo-[acyl-carrier protein] synthase [Edwardsiella ictaluri]QPW25586.1 citrate lyase holo-[acyl-carrier protein] synthase [Edwardsiella ictaluri]
MMPLLPHLAASHTVTLPELLLSRECRQSRQTAWLARHTCTLISFTVVSPGPVKDSPLTRRIFNAGIAALNQLAQRQEWSIREQRSLDFATGPEGLMAIDASAERVKWATIALEQSHPLGRLWDMDVVASDGQILSRGDHQLPARRCLICQRPAVLCARERRHDVAQLLAHMEALLHDAESDNA